MSAQALPRIDAAPVLPAALGNLLLGLATVLPLAVALKAAAAYIGGGAAAVSLQQIMASFISPEICVFYVSVPVFLLIEVWAAGWERSSVRRLLVAPSVQARGDVIMLLFTLSGGAAAAITVCSLGLADLAMNLLNAHSTRGPLSQLPAWAGGPLLYLGMTFCNYWMHRLMHTPLFWKLHAFHHAAKEFTTINSTRVTMVEGLLVGVAQALPAALLGASPEAILIASLIAGHESLWTHNNIAGLHWLERFGISSPKLHMIHHGLAERFHNRNFGDLICVWDRLFGTYLPSAAVGEVEMGVDDPQGLYLNDRPLAGWLRLQWLWLRGLVPAGVARLAAAR